MSHAPLAIVEDPFRLIADHVRFASEQAYVWSGKEFPHRPDHTRFIRQSGGYPTVVAEVGQIVYDRLYTRPDEGTGGHLYVHDPLLQQDHVDRLARVNTTTVSWVPGWRAEGHDGTKLRVRGPDGETRLVDPGEYQGPLDGGEGKVRAEKGSYMLQPGWYHVRGHEDHPFGRPPTLRLYWNVCPAGAAPLVAQVTKILNDAGVPFRFKITDDPQRYRRADAGVLYLPAQAWPDAVGPVTRIHASVAGYLKAPIPLFTKRLEPGLGVAEDPANHESVGMHRSRLAAEGLWDAHQDGLTEPEDLVKAMHARFRKDGLAPARPHLNPGSVHDYDLAPRLLAVAAGRRA